MNVNIKNWLLATRVKTLPNALMPVILGNVFAIKHGNFSYIPAVLCAIFALLIQIGTNYANDYFDYIKNSDTKNRIGPKRMVASGNIKPEHMWISTIFVLSLALIIGANLIFYSDWWLIFIGFSAVFCAIGYTGGPYPLGYNCLGDIFILIFFGLIATIFTFYIQCNYFSWDVFFTSIAIGLLINNVFIITSYRDIEEDSKSGKTTLAVQVPGVVIK